MSSASLQQSAKRLTSDKVGFEPVKPLPTKGARPGERSTGRPSSANQAAAGTSLQESDYDARVYWAPVTLTSSDGIFTIEVEPIRSVSLVGDGLLSFDQPT